MTSMPTQRVNPGVIAPLQDALVAIYWYKNDLFDFLNATLKDRSLVERLDRDLTKRAIVRDLVSYLVDNQHRYFSTLVSLILAVAGVNDPSHLKRLEEGEEKYQEAVEAVATLCLYVEPYRKIKEQADAAARRREEEKRSATEKRAKAAELADLNRTFVQIRSEPAQKRGCSLEDLLNRLFALFEIDAKGSFRIRGEQIDGAFTFDGTEFLLEAKWQKDLTPTSDLDIFSRKVERKLDNTLGLFVSMNGFQTNALDLAALGSRPVLILMDGADLAAVLEARIPLVDLLAKKKQHAARTGEIFLSSWQILAKF
ncbi:restriction endonuclease [Nocardiopsis sp. CNR-923]|uniref:restriction endonuclease n=1 Tax=Nocardiopsis sp. CNR-923 TaxID=1904965 RepID=UPI0011806ADF|nr:restriction endonuclease [Nocardiopsis sp. CNR-923]